MISLIDASLDFGLQQEDFQKILVKFTKFLGVGHCLLANSGSSANLLAISRINITYSWRKAIKAGG